MKQTHSICCKKIPIRLLMHGLENVITYTMFVVIFSPPVTLATALHILSCIETPMQKGRLYIALRQVEAKYNKKVILDNYSCQYHLSNLIR